MFFFIKPKQRVLKEGFCNILSYIPVLHILSTSSIKGLIIENGSFQHKVAKIRTFVIFSISFAERRAINTFWKNHQKTHNSIFRNGDCENLMFAFVLVVASHCCAKT